LKKWANYEKQLEKENSKRKKSSHQQASKRQRRNNRPRVRFPGKIVLLEAAARSDIEDGKSKSSDCEFTWLGAGCHDAVSLFYIYSL